MYDLLICKSRRMQKKYKNWFILLGAHILPQKLKPASFSYLASLQQVFCGFYHKSSFAEEVEFELGFEGCLKFTKARDGVEFREGALRGHQL